MFAVASSEGLLATLGINHYVVSGWGVIALVALLSWLATRNLKTVPRGLQNAVEAVFEWLFETLQDLFGGSYEKTKKYFPFLCTFFLFILGSNYIGLLPLSGEAEFMYIPMTSTLSCTACFAIIVFFATHICGFMEHGPGYLKHFIKPFAVMLPMNLLEEVVRPVSLAFRLYGNIYGHELVIATLMTMIPWGFPAALQLLGALTGLIQAGVFTLLAALYIGEAVEEK